jgi:hypothetical protein
MSTSLLEKIEAIREEPEHVRMRYAMICVSVSMLFIFGIWLFSVEESVTTTTAGVPQAMEKGKDLGSAPSLNDLFERSAPLRVESQPANGSEFFQQQVQGQGSEGGEGVMTPPAPAAK